MGNFRIYYRIGMAAEKNILFDDAIKDTYYGIVVGANVAAYGKSWVSQFLRSLSKPFFIDPLTYAFQTHREYILKKDEVKKDKVKKDEVKKSYLSLAKEYGKLIKRVIIDNERELVPKDFNDEDLTVDFVKCAIEFQKKITFGITKSQKSLLEDYPEILGITEELSSEREPEFLVVPYFYFKNTKDPWYGVNLRLIDFTKELFSGSRIYGVICTEKKAMFEREEVAKIARDYSNTEGIILWFSDFNELNQEKEIIKAYTGFLKRLSFKDIISMYGGYFSLLSSKFGLKGYSPGIGVSEYKNVTKRLTGGVFTNRYYIPQVKTIVVEAEARKFYHAYPTELCRCNICNEIVKAVNLDASEFFSRLTVEHAKKHYCLCKNEDNKYIQEHSLLEICEKLKRDFDFCDKKIDQVYNIRYEHLGVWVSVLEDVIAGNIVE